MNRAVSDNFMVRFQAQQRRARARFLFRWSGRQIQKPFQAHNEDTEFEANIWNRTGSGTSNRRCSQEDAQNGSARQLGNPADEIEWAY